MPDLATFRAEWPEEFHGLLAPDGLTTSGLRSLQGASKALVDARTTFEKALTTHRRGKRGTNGKRRKSHQRSKPKGGMA